jgi:hypothetical protein
MWKDFWSICKAYNGGYVAAGYYSENEYNASAIITRIDDLGNIIWEQKYDTVGTYTFNTIYSIQQSNGGYIFTPLQAVKISTSKTMQSFIKVDSSGNVLTMKVIPENHFKYSSAGDLRIINPNRYLICGSVSDTTGDTVWASITITDSSGNVMKKHLFTDSYCTLEECYMINDNDFVLIGVSDFLRPNGDYNAYIVRTDTNFNIPPISIESISKNVPAKFILYQNYPNPFNSSTIIEYDIPENNYVELIIYDVLGREVKTLVNEYKKVGSYSVKFDGSNLASGLYFYKIEAGNYVETKKMVMIK